MKIVITGSLGNISLPLTKLLLQNKHSVTVISSNPARQKEIEALGAKAAIGTMQDVPFLTRTFTGADIVYCMESLGHGFFFDHNLDVLAAIMDIANSYRLAIEASGVKKVVHLSSVGAHTTKGNGMLAFHFHAERIMNELPGDVAIKFMRPVGFYYNVLAYIPTVKATGKIIQNYGGDEKEPWVSPDDIASTIAEAIEAPFEGRTIQYIASEELSPNEVAKILGTSIGQPQLQWMEISDEKMEQNLVAAGMNPAIAQGLVAMNEGRKTGILYEDYNRNKPVLGKTKLEVFAQQFAAIYNKS